jgi:hypothetical protein
MFPLCGSPVLVRYFVIIVATCCFGLFTLMNVNKSRNNVAISLVERASSERMAAAAHN